MPGGRNGSGDDYDPNYNDPSYDDDEREAVFAHLHVSEQRPRLGVCSLTMYCDLLEKNGYNGCTLHICTPLPHGTILMKPQSHSYIDMTELLSCGPLARALLYLPCVTSKHGRLSQTLAQVRIDDGVPIRCDCKDVGCVHIQFIEQAPPAFWNGTRVRDAVDLRRQCSDQWMAIAHIKSTPSRELYSLWTPMDEVTWSTK